MSKSFQKITPYLWFGSQAEEAVNFYISLFGNSRIKSINHYGESGAKLSGMPEGSVMTIVFELAGQEFAAFNAGPHFKFNEAVSFVVNCDSQQEVDELWEKLSEGGAKQPCGWLKDKFGLSWQIIPTIFTDMITDSDPEKTERVMSAMYKMTKLEIDKLVQAYEGK